MSTLALSPTLAAVSVLAQESNAAAAGGIAAFGVLWLLFIVVGLALTVFWIWMLIDCLTSNLPTNEKILWAVVIALFNALGALIYFFVGRGNRSVA